MASDDRGNSTPMDNQGLPRDTAGSTTIKTKKDEFTAVDDKKWKWGKHPFAVKYTPKVFASFSKANQEQDNPLDVDVLASEEKPEDCKTDTPPKTPPKRLPDISSRWLKDQVSNLLTKGRSPESGGTKVIKPDNVVRHSPEILIESSEVKITTDTESNNDLTSVTAESADEQPVMYRLSLEEAQTVNANRSSFLVPEDPRNEYLSSASEKSESTESLSILASNLNAGQDTVAGRPDYESFSTVDRADLERPLLHSSSISLTEGEGKGDHNLQKSVQKRVADVPHKTKAKIKNIFSPHRASITTDLTHLPANLSLASQASDNDPINESTLKSQSADCNPMVSSKLKFSDLLKKQNEIPTESNIKEPTKMTDNGSVKLMPMESIDDDDEKELYNSDLPISKEYTATGSCKGICFNIWVMSIITYCLMIMPLPDSINGMIAGALFMYLLCCLIVWLLCPSMTSYKQYTKDLRRYLAGLEKEDEQSSSLGTTSATSLQKPRDMKGWIHYTDDYNPDSFNMTETQDVYASLKHQTMCIFFGNRQLASLKQVKKAKKRRRALRKKAKRQAQEELANEPQFVFVKLLILDIPKCSLSIEPADLAMKRIWNRKFPICLHVPAGCMATCELELSLEEVNSHHVTFADCDEEDGQFNTGEVVFYVLPNTGREKEDWFYQLQLCIQPLKHQISEADYVANRLSRNPATSYAHYMVERLAESRKVLQRVSHGKKIEPHLAWLNALCGRAFWDVWHEPFWNTKIKNKIQRRLSKLNTPPFITDITVTDLHLGHSLPIIHKGSLPVVDEYGVWADLQVTYKGGFTLTLETQLNVDYYVQLITKLAAKNQPTQPSHVDGSDPVGFSKLKAEETRQEETMAHASAAGQAASPYTSDDDQEERLHDELPGVFFEAMDDVELDEEDMSGSSQFDPFLSDPRTRAFLDSKTGKKVANVVGWLAKSKFAKRVAETDLAKKAYEKAYEKFRKMPIVLKVEVQSLKGTLAVNIPPPPTNRLWYGFRGNPVVLMTALPRLGEKQVRLTYLTDWIEQKLKDELQKLFVLPSMQDITVRLMDSKLEDLFPDRPYTY